MYFSKLFKIKDGKLEVFRDWMDQLGTARRDEALATFAFEHVSREIFVLFRGLDNTHFVIGLNEANGTPGESDASLPINQQHAAIKKECLEVISEPGEILLDLKFAGL